jgi:ATP-dependent DNA helicase RecQ
VAIESGQGLSVAFDIDKICNSYNLLPVLVYNSIKFLEKENYLSFLDAGFEASKVLMLGNKEELYSFQIKHPKYEPTIKTLLRSYGGLFEDYVFINEKELAYRIKTNATELVEQLKFLDKMGLLSYVPQSSLPKLIFIQDRVNTKFLEFNPENYQKLKQRYLERINSVIDYTNEDKVCRQVQLLIYFNEFNYSDCGHCDVCISKRPKDFEKVKAKIVDIIKVQPMTLNDLKEKMKSVNDETWVKAFNELVDDGRILEHETVFYLKKYILIKDLGFILIKPLISRITLIYILFISQQFAK